MSRPQTSVVGRHSRCFRTAGELCLGLSLLGCVAASPGAAQAPERKIAEMELLLLGVAATVEPLNPVIPKNTDAGVRIVVRHPSTRVSLGRRPWVRSRRH